MKKKKKKIAALSLAVLVAGTGAFHAYSNYQQSGESDALLNENILALSSESEVEVIVHNEKWKERPCQQYGGIYDLALEETIEYVSREEGSITPYESSAFSVGTDDKSMTIGSNKGNTPKNYVVTVQDMALISRECIPLDNGCCKLTTTYEERKLGSHTENRTRKS